MTDKVYVLVDGENIDTTLGKILERKPFAEDRTRWQQVLNHASSLYPGSDLHSLFFLHAVSDDTLPLGFIKALSAMGFVPVPLRGSGDASEQVVDIGLSKMLRSILDQGQGDVIVVSHDGGFADEIKELLDAGREVSVVGFTEFMSAQYVQLQDDGLVIYDLEHDVGAFDFELPRLRVIDLQAFDPERYL